MTDRWIGRVKPDPKGLEDNPYLKPKNKAEPAARPQTAPEPVTVLEGASIAEVGFGFINLKDVVCVDADGNKIESYDRLQVDGHYSFKTSMGVYHRATGYEAQAYFEKQNNGWFLPSFALTCKILETLYANRTDPKVRAILEEYNYNTLEKFAGKHIQNTIIDTARAGSNQIIHYPRKDDFPVAAQILTGQQNQEINTRRERKVLEFDTQMRQYMRLEEAMRYTPSRRFLQNLTGLRNPAVLSEIAEYFRKNQYLFTKRGGKFSTWMGCNETDFVLELSTSVESGRGLFRGVRPVE